MQSGPKKGAPGADHAVEVKAAETDFEKARKRILQNPENAHEVLGLTPSATQNNIRTAYKQLSLLLHPDKNPGAPETAKELIQHVNNAYNALKDPLISQRASMPAGMRQSTMKSNRRQVTAWRGGVMRLDFSPARHRARR